MSLATEAAERLACEQKRVAGAIASKSDETYESA